MTCNVSGGTLSVTQSVSFEVFTHTELQTFACQASQ